MSESGIVLPEIYHRSATLEDVNVKKGLVDLIAVPWDEETERALAGGQAWRESFDRHAFDGIENHAGRVAVNREHVKGDTVGRAVLFDPSYPAGLFARVKMADTPRGHETLTLTEEGMIFPSVGYRVNRPNGLRVNRRTMSRRILKGWIDHLAMVEDPAYTGAEVLAVRAGQSGLTVVEHAAPPETPALDEAMNDDLYEWAAERLSRRNN